jgi:hypothetical protein
MATVITAVSALRAGVLGDGADTHNPQVRATLLQMAQVWFRLAEDHAADDAGND